MNPLRTLVLFAVLVSGCVSNGPVFSARDDTMFGSAPVVIRHKSYAVLTWTQGSFPFFFLPQSQIVEGKLVFSVRGSASSGSLAGQMRQVTIETPEELMALDRGVFFWEPEPKPRGTLVPIEVQREP